MEAQHETLFRMIDQHSSDECLDWPFRIDDDGYGNVWFEGNNRKAHRIAYRYAFEAITWADVIRHSCDNPRCFNPRHLIKGTHADNVADRVARGRSALGTANGRSKLSPEQVREIFLSAEPKMHLAARFCVDAKVIRNIKDGTNWGSVTASLVAGLV